MVVSQALMASGRAYLDKHGVNEVLQAAVKKILLDKPADPLGELSRILRRCKLGLSDEQCYAVFAAVDPGDAASFATIDSIARNILEGGKPTINFVHVE